MKRRAFLLSLPLWMGALQAVSAPDLLGIPLRDIEGKETTLSRFSGKVLLIVNVASECGYTNQYEGLEALYRKYTDRGLVVLGFPCNDFGGQEPADNKEIQQFCKSKYHVTFPMFAKVNIRGGEPHPLFAGLTGVASPFPGPVQWNFNKFLIGRDGLQSARFPSDTEPDSGELQAAIEKALSAPK
ncbi:MAG: glutathione peroxidase [Verrucomicrobiota bacterium]